MQISAPAKINLTLRVLGKRPDGYHELESVMQMLALADTLTIDDADELRFTCSDPALEGPENLVLRAAQLLKGCCAGTRGARIHLDKAIPVQAGLGGGSSDAAAALAALNEFWDIRLPLDELALLAARLGSDVPFFLDGPTAIVRGRGEQVTPVPRHGEVYCVLAKPSAGLSTPQVYAHLQAPPLPAHLPERTAETAAMLAALQTGDPRALAGALVNDLAAPAFGLLPDLSRVKARMLQQGCLGVILCGSGSALAGICPDEATARHAAIDLTNDCPWTWAGKWMTG